jgi:hypothetical protein
MKGFDVVTCPWNNASSAAMQVQDMLKFRDHSSAEMKDHFMGLVQTVWSGAEQFLDSFYGRKTGKDENPEVSCFRSLCGEMKKSSDLK